MASCSHLSSAVMPLSLGEIRVACEADKRVSSYYFIVRFACQRAATTFPDHAAILVTARELETA